MTRYLFLEPSTAREVNYIIMKLLESCFLRVWNKAYLLNVFYLIFFTHMALIALVIGLSFEKDLFKMTSCTFTR